MNKDSIDNSGHLMVIGPGAAPGHPHTQPDARGTGGEALCEHLVLEMPVLLKRIPANHFFRNACPPKEDSCKSLLLN